MAELKRFYDFFAPFYDRVFSPSLARARQRGMALAAIEPHHRVLEVGVGTGLTASLYPKGSTVVGVDYSEDMLKVARTRLRGQTDSAVRELHRMDANHLEFPDESFDVVVGAHFLSATPTPVRALQEMKRVCRPNGRIVLINAFQSPNRAVRMAQRLLDPVTRRIGFSVQLDLDRLARAAGLQVTRRERVSTLLHVEAAVLQP